MARSFLHVAALAAALSLLATPAAAQLCDQGILSACGNVCCDAGCGVCGGCACASRPGGPSNCCPSNILFAGFECMASDDVGCVLDAGAICAEPAEGCSNRLSVPTPLDPDIARLRAFLYNGALIQADLWDPVPQILSASLGVEGLIGFDRIDPATLAAAGAAFDVVVAGGAPRLITRAILTARVNATYLGNIGGPGAPDDAIPVVFSWPIAGETLRPKQFKYTLNDGRIVYPKAVGLVPNQEFNERSLVVTIGEFGNRIPPGQPGSLHPVLLEMVADGGVALSLVGIDFAATPPTLTTVSTEGMTFATGSGAFAPNAGPKMIRCKLTYAGVRVDGEGVPPVNAILAPYAPNDEIALYGPAGPTKFVVRGLTTGGFSRDGITPMSAGDYELFFRLLALPPSCDPGDGLMPLIEVGVPYGVCGGNVTILGLSDLGPPDQTVPDPRFLLEDTDNYIDVVFTADTLAAAKAVKALDTPTSAVPGYTDIFNPTGPGTNPTPGVMYSEPGPPTTVFCSDETAFVLAVSRPPQAPLP